MIEIDGLSFRYPSSDFALAIERFEVQRGVHTALIGPSGCGKTTLLSLIAGVLLPDAGRVVTVGEELGTLGDRARRDLRVRRVGLVFQEFELLEYLSVLDNILLPYRVNRTLGLDASARSRARDLAARVGVADKLERYPHRLSQGERQRVAVCRALVTEPPLLLADEPTGNLDPVNKSKVLDLFLDCAEESGATVVAVTHDHDLLPRFERVVDFKSFYAEAADSEGGLS
jgi:putative ABC transport system ATP-binding protein